MFYKCLYFSLQLFFLDNHQLLLQHKLQLYVYETVGKTLIWLLLIAFFQK